MYKDTSLLHKGLTILSVIADRAQNVNLTITSVAQLCPTFYNPMDCSTPGFPVHHQLLEINQTHVHQVGDSVSFSVVSDRYPMDCSLPISSVHGILQTRILGRPRGMVWGGRREEGSGWGTHVYLWQIHFDIWQN